MNRDVLVNLIVTALGIIVFVVLWPIIKWLALIALVLILGLVVWSMIASKKMKKKIMEDPNAYYASVDNSNKDVIDVQYKEKVLEEK